MKAALYYDAKDVRIEEFAEPAAEAGKVKVKIKYAGICGTDLGEYHNKQFVPTTPMILGHEFTGEVVEVGEDVTMTKIGDRVAVEPIWGCGECESCRKGNYNICENMESYGIHEHGGFAEYVSVKEENIYKLPDTMSYELAALIEPTAVAIHAIRKSSMKIGDTVAVFGAGPIGLLVAESLRAAGASKIFVVEVSEERQQIARELGIDDVIDPTKEDATGKIKQLTGGGVDLAFEAAGVEVTFHSALDSLKPNGELMIVSVFSNPVSYHPALQLVTEKKINSSLGYNNIYGEVLDLLARGSINAEPIITSKISLDDIVEQGFEKLVTDKSQCKILVAPEM